ncbi:MAG TPA: ABC transporter ATP-binding protein [Candidatus Binatia bacterium]|nr:ABC transporter ATP-binding protein [Candidatus Binatia bacterium]
MATANDDLMVRIRGLTFAFGPRVIFDGVDMDVRRGRVTAVMGPSGIGKTTLFRLIGGQYKPQKGTIEFDGVNVHALPRRELFALRQKMGMMFQHGALLTDLSVFDNVAFPLREHTRLPEAMIRDIVMLKLEAVGLRGAAALSPHECSGGMQRRIAFARAVALDPQMVMYDEPFTGQDPINLGVLQRLVRSLNDSLGLTSMIVSHDVGETLDIADDVYMIAAGRIADRGTPEQIRASKSPWVQQFLKGEHDGPVPFHVRAEQPYAADLMGAGAAA